MTGLVIVLFWVVHGALLDAHHAETRRASTAFGHPEGAQRGPLVRHRRPRPRRVRAHHGRRPHGAHHRAARHPARPAVGRHHRPHRRLLPGPHRRHHHAPRRRAAGAADHHHLDPRPLAARQVVRHPHPRHRGAVHAGGLAHHPLGGDRRARARVRHGGPPARRALGVRHGARDPAQHHPADHRRGHGAPGLRRVHRRHPVVPRLRPRAAVARLGPHHRHRAGHTCRSPRGRCCSRPSPWPRWWWA